MNPRRSRAIFAAIAIPYFVILPLLFFADALRSPRAVISAPGLDIDRQFYPFSAYAFGQIRAGHFPLWNPYSFGGMPALGSLQYGLLYPPNWLNLLLPTNLAINWLIVLHVALAGLLMAVWCRFRSASIVGSLLGGMLFMFSGPIMMRVNGGYLPYLYVVAWMPLVLLCIDAIIDRRRERVAVLLGAAVIAMQILAGHPHPIYCFALVLMVYVGLRVVHAKQRTRAIACIAAMYLGGALISAAQLLPAIDTLRESVRAGYKSDLFSSTFSFPPENLLTLVVPHLIGDSFDSPYVGRGGMWETSIFIGAVGATLAVVGAIAGRSWRDRTILAAIVFTLILVLGKTTPVYHIFIRIVPGMENLRGPARFSFLLALFISALAAGGFDHLWQTNRLRPAAITAAICAMLLVLAGLVIGHSQVWQSALSRLYNTGEVWGIFDLSQNPSLVTQSAQFATSQLIAVAGSFAQIALVLGLAQRWRKLVYLLPILALGELWVGSIPAWQSFIPMAHLTPQPEVQDNRTLVLGDRLLNLPVQSGVLSITGFDATVPARWANLVAPLIGADALSGDFRVHVLHPSPIWSMLRLGATLPPGSLKFDPMPRIQLIDNYQLASNPAASLQAVNEPSFDPRKTVILETPPNPVPISGDHPAGNATLLRTSDESLEISADLTRPAILLVTDSYSKGWRARPLESGPQATYEVMPANHALRAIPLATGKHHLLLEYRPLSVPIGIGISVVSLIAWVIACSYQIVLRLHSVPRHGDSLA